MSFVWLFPCWVQCSYITHSPPGRTVTTSIPSLLLFCFFFILRAGNRAEKQIGEETRKRKKRRRLIPFFLCPFLVWFISLLLLWKWVLSSQPSWRVNSIMCIYVNQQSDAIRHATFTIKQDIWNMLHSSYLPTENKSTKVCRWTLVWVTILSSLVVELLVEQCPPLLTVACLEKTKSSCLHTKPGVVEDDFSTTDSASPRQTSAQVNFLPSSRLENPNQTVCVKAAKKRYKRDADARHSSPI